MAGTAFLGLSYIMLFVTIVKNHWPVSFFFQTILHYVYLDYGRARFCSFLNFGAMKNKKYRSHDNIRYNG